MLNAQCPNVDVVGYEHPQLSIVSDDSSRREVLLVTHLKASGYV
jgi:hypothetical protein